MLFDMMLRENVRRSTFFFFLERSYDVICIGLMNVLNNAWITMKHFTFYLKHCKCFRTDLLAGNRERVSASGKLRGFVCVCLLHVYLSTGVTNALTRLTKTDTLRSTADVLTVTLMTHGLLKITSLWLWFIIYKRVCDNGIKS